MSIKTRFLMILLISAITLSFAVFPSLKLQVQAITSTEPHDANSIWFEPSPIELNASEISVGYKFNVTAFANSSLECKGWQFWLYYANANINATKAGYTAGTKSEFLQDLTTLPITPSFKVNLNATHNRLDFGEAWLMGPFREPGHGSLCWIEFEVVNLPPVNQTVNISLNIAEAHESMEPPQTYLLYSDNTKRPLSVYNGLVKFVAEEPPPPPPPPPEGTIIFVDPHEIIDPTMLPSSTFSVNITVDDVGDLNVCWFNLSYNTEVIGWIGLKLFRVQDQPPTAMAIMDDEAGFIWINLTYGTPFTALEPTALVKLDFHVEALGATPLDLHDTELVDSLGNPINHTAVDGFFLTLIRDIAITNVVPSQSWVYQGWNISIEVSVKNKGNISETFSVAVYYDSNILGNVTVEDLAPGTETMVTVIWNTENVTACTNYTMSATIPLLPYEWNTFDNEFIDSSVGIRLLGDVNGDGTVGIDDIVLASEAFGSTPGHPRWNIYADMNNDDYVGIDDIVMIADNFGNTC